MTETTSDANSNDANSNDKPKEPTIHLDQFLKTCGVATGGQAKVMIQAGEVLVNNEVETRRRKQLRVGDEVTLHDVTYVVSLGEAVDDETENETVVDELTGDNATGE